MKKGSKLLFAMLALLGAGAVLTACSFDATQSNAPTTSVNADDKSQTTKVSEKSEDTQQGSTTQSSSDNNSISSSEEIIDPAQLLHYEEEIETKLKNKLNDRIGMEYVTNVDAKYFTLKDVDSTKVLEANGSISIVGKQEESEVSLGLPITAAQYQTLSNEDFISHSASSDLAENYNLQNLQAVDSILSADSITFSYATKNNTSWNLETVSASEIEAELEARYTESARQFFLETMDDPYFINADFKTIEVRHDSYRGDYFVFNGTAVVERNNKVVSFNVRITPSEENFELMQSTFVVAGDSTKNLAENYTLEQMNILKNICDVSRVQAYCPEGSVYTVKNVSNSENTL